MFMAAVKRCSKCSLWKPFSGFAKNASKDDGLQNWCRLCASEERKRNRSREQRRVNAWRRAHPEAANRYLREARDEVIAHYSQSQVPTCACCGEDEKAFLVLDHINGGGNVERKKWGRNLHIRIRSGGFPPGYQVLCWNCNAAKAYQGICPHEAARRSDTA